MREKVEVLEDHAHVPAELVDVRAGGGEMCIRDRGCAGPEAAAAASFPVWPL